MDTAVLREVSRRSAHGWPGQDPELALQCPVHQGAGSSSDLQCPVQLSAGQWPALQSPVQVQRRPKAGTAVPSAGPVPASIIAVACIATAHRESTIILHSG